MYFATAWDLEVQPIQCECALVPKLEMGGGGKKKKKKKKKKGVAVF